MRPTILDILHEMGSHFKELVYRSWCNRNHLLVTVHHQLLFLALLLSRVVGSVEPRYYRQFSLG